MASRRTSQGMKTTTVMDNICRSAGRPCFSVVVLAASVGRVEVEQHVLPIVAVDSLGDQSTSCSDQNKVVRSGRTEGRKSVIDGISRSPKDASGNGFERGSVMDNVRYYKFMNKKYVETFMNGEIMLGSLDYFRRLEGETGDDKIGDINEGRHEWRSGELRLKPSDAGYREKMDLLREGLPGIEFGRFVSIEGGQIIKSSEQRNGLIFCCSNGPFEPLRELMCETGPEALRYDAWVSISDVGELVKALVETGRFVETGEPINQGFNFHWRPVVYEDVVTTGLEGKIPQAHAFRKALKYQTQMEWRLFCEPLKEEPPLPEQALVRFVPPKGLFSIQPWWLSSHIARR